jgi:IrrE N-terminal-like domain
MQQRQRHKHAKLLKKLTNACTKRGYQPYWSTQRAMGGEGHLGVTDHNRRIVRIAKDQDPDQQIGVLCHELAHIELDHRHRHQPWTRGSQPGAEVEAETVACLVCEGLGVPRAHFSRDYIRGYGVKGGGHYDADHVKALTTGQKLLKELTA